MDIKRAIEEVKVLTLDLQNYEETSTAYGDAAGIYAIWGNAALKKVLSDKSLKIHTSKENQKRMDLSKPEVTLNLKSAIKCSVQIDFDGKKLFCLYVGKTANLKKRQQIRRFGKLTTSSAKQENDAIIDFSSLKTMLHVSFIKKDDWIDRFFLENLAIGLLKPVLNIQPER